MEVLWTEVYELEWIIVQILMVVLLLLIGTGLYICVDAANEGEEGGIFFSIVLTILFALVMWMGSTFYKEGPDAYAYVKVTDWDVVMENNIEVHERISDDVVKIKVDIEELDKYDNP